jgi:hypothetical protein
MFSPGLLGNFGQRRRSKHTSRDPFQGVDQGGECYLGRVCDEQVDVVVLEACFLELALEVGAYRDPGGSKQETEGKTACSTSLAFGKAPPFREVLFTVDHLKAAYLHLGGTL